MLPEPPFPNIPDLSPLPHLGVPDGEDLAAQFLAEHGGHAGWASPLQIVTGDGDMDETFAVFTDQPTDMFVIGFDGPDRCLVDGMDDEQLARARTRIGEPR